MNRDRLQEIGWLLVYLLGGLGWMGIGHLTYWVVRYNPYGHLP